MLFHTFHAFFNMGIQSPFVPFRLTTFGSFSEWICMENSVPSYPHTPILLLLYLHLRHPLYIGNTLS